jgi:dCTP deaminase
MNLSLGIIITLFMALIMIFLRKRENDKFMKCLVIVLIAVLIASLVALSIGLV